MGQDTTLNLRDLVTTLTHDGGELAPSNLITALLGTTTLAPDLTEAPAHTDTTRLGRFQVERPLGAGGMGVVWQAWDPELHRSIAIKSLKDPEAVRPRRLARFIAEARITSQLQHPNIVPVHDLGLTPEGEIFFVMKNVQGATLAQVLESGEPESALSPGFGLTGADPASRHRLLTAFVQIGQAVAYAHSRGALHRDLKPTNLMIGAFGEVVVMDWGITRLMANPVEPVDPLSGPPLSDPPPDTQPEPLAVGPNTPTPEPLVSGNALRTREGSVMGTPGYMSPEQARGELTALDGRSDLWSLGAILFEMLTLQPAVPDVFTRGLAYAQRPGPPPDPRVVAPERRIPDEIAEICMRALSFDRDARQESVATLVAEVEAFLDGSRRREAALDLVLRAHAHRASIREATARVAELRAESAAALAGIPAYAPETDKARGWELDAEAERLCDQMAIDESRFVHALHAALERAPELTEAHTLLAQHYQEKHQEAERTGDTRGAARLEVLLRAHDTGVWATYLAGEGVLDLGSDPPGAEVVAFRYTEHHRRLVPMPHPIRLGQTPIRGLHLPMGSYLLVLQAEGRPPVRYPVSLRRNEHWTGIAPGDTTPTPVYLPPMLDEADVLVPAGWFDSGGDTLAAGALPGRRVWVDSFVIRRFPVTHGEWLLYLQDLVNSGRGDEALARVPRATAAAESDAGSALYDVDPETGHFVLRPADAGGLWGPTHPVCNIDWASAAAYAAWYAERTGLPYRLPSELEWEKAARGVDGRPLPWGRTHDFSWAVTGESHAGPPAPQPIDSFPVDVSPYGVRGMGGGVRDWVLEGFAPEGPPISADGRLVVQLDQAHAPMHGTRGGAWSLPAWVSRVCCRGYHPPIRLADLGFRLLRPLSAPR